MKIDIPYKPGEAENFQGVYVASALVLQTSTGSRC